MEDPPPQEAFGPYRVVRTLGRGGMGVVYEAAHGETGRRVALKTVRVPRAALVASIRREIRALARLAHPDVVAIVEEGVERGVPWYAMELLEGATLRDEVRARSARSTSAEEATIASAPADGDGTLRSRSIDLPGPLAAPPFDVQTAATIVARLCEPLAYLHAEGIVHRDLKPENVVIRASGRPALLDLGTVASFPVLGGRELLQSAGLVTGTVFYMSPEQSVGELVDARSDVYALGCILHELLTGLPPFIGSPTEILAQHRGRVPAPPSRRAAVPVEIDALVGRMLAKSPRDRPGNALAVAHVLRPFIAPGAVEQAREGAPPARRRSVSLFRPQLRGRQAVMDALTSHLHQAIGGAGRLVALVGEGGAGKTAAAMALAQLAARRDVEVRPCPCRRARGETTSLLAQLLEPVVDACRERGAEWTRRVLGVDAAVLATIRPDLRDLPGYDGGRVAPAPDAARVYDAIRTAWCSHGSRPRLWILDDVHLADAASLELLLHLLRSGALADIPALVLVTCSVPRDAPLLGRLLARAAATIELPPLHEDDLAAVAADVLGLARPRSVGRALAARAAGNPSLLAEHLRLAVDEGLLLQELDGTWIAAEGRDWQASLPGNIGALVSRRIDRLDEPARRVAECAAVMADDVRAGAVARAASLPEEETLDLLETLRREGLLEASGDDAYQFVHPVAAELLEERLPPDALRDLHRAAAVELEASPDRRERLASLARHYLAADERARARPLLWEAANDALDRFADAAGERLLRQYLELEEPGSRGEVDARHLLGERVLAMRDRGEALVQFQRAAEVAAAIGDTKLEIRASLSASVILEQLGRFPEARAILERITPRARAFDEPVLLAGVLVRLGGMRASDDGHEAAAVLQEEAMALVDRFPENLRVAAGRFLTTIAMTRARAGDVAGAREAQERALEIQRQNGDLRAAAISLSNLAAFEMQARRYGGVREKLDAAREQWAAIGSREGEAVTLVNLSVLASDLGRPEEALRDSDAAVRLARGLEAPTLLVHALLGQGVALGDLGRHDEAAAAIAEGLSIVASLPDRRPEPVLRHAMAELDLHRGEPRRAANGFTAALACARQLHDRTQEARALCGRSEAARRLGDLGAARADSELAMECASRDPGLQLDALVALAHVDVAEGRSGEEALARVRRHHEAHRLEGPQSRKRIEALARSVDACRRGDAPAPAKGATPRRA